MKKIVVLLLTVALLCSVGLADVLNFGDFNIDLDPAMPGMINEKEDGQVFMYLYPFYDENVAFHDNINVVWLEGVEDVTTIDTDEYAATVVPNAADALAASGVAAENPVLYLCTLDEQDGVPAIAVMYSYDVDFSGVGLDLQCTLYYVQFTVSVEGVGTYVFTVTASDPEHLDPMIEILNTMTWNF